MGDGLFNKLKELVGIEEIEDEEEFEEEMQKSVGRPMERKAVEMKTPYSSPISSRVETKDGREVNVRDANVISMQQNKGGALNSITSQFKLVVTEPKSFDECPKMVDNLKSRKPIIINLEKIETDVARKIFDFLSGATYALNGNVQKIANNIFVFVPENVDVSANGEPKPSSEYAGAQGAPTKTPWR